MGDVVTALGRAVQEEGHKVEVILPKYDCIQYDEVGFFHVATWLLMQAYFHCISNF